MNSDDFFLVVSTSLVPTLLQEPQSRALLQVCTKGPGVAEGE